MIDQAGNTALISEDEVVYYDKTPPVKPHFINAGGPSYGTIPDWVSSKTRESNNGYIKDTRIDLTTEAESLSDVEIWAYDKSGTLSDYKLFQNDGDRMATRSFGIGTQGDDRAGCVQLVNGRRLGVCQDGNYKFKVKSTDAPGNPSVTTMMSVERDTVRPEKPVIVEHVEDLQTTYYLNAKGESGTTLFVKVSSSYGTYYKQFVMTSGEINTANILSDWNWDTLYNFEIYLSDKAGNLSEVVKLSYTTPPFPAGSGEGDVLGSANDLYAGKFGWDEEVTFDVIIDQNGNYEIENIKIPAPILTYAFRTKKEADVYGVGIPMDVKIKPTFIRRYMTYVEATEACGVSRYAIWMSKEKEDCVKSKMGIDYGIYQWARDRQWECGWAIPIYTQLCYLDKQETWVVEKTSNSGTFNTEKVLIKLYKDPDVYLTELLNDHKDEATQKYDGRFNHKFTLGDSLKGGDKVKAKAFVFGKLSFDGIEINYSGLSQDEVTNNTGIASPYSNALTIPTRSIYMPSVTPFNSDQYTNGQTLTLTQGMFADFSHSNRAAYDIVRPYQTPILAAMPGTATVKRDFPKTSGSHGYGYYIVIQNAEYLLEYGHTDAKTLDLYKNEEGKEISISVKPGDVIGYLDHSGNVPNHLHFELKILREAKTPYYGIPTCQEAHEIVKPLIEPVGAWTPGNDYTTEACK